MFKIFSFSFQCLNALRTFGAFDGCEINKGHKNAKTLNSLKDLSLNSSMRVETALQLVLDAF